jgi:hypothetical protein
MGPLAFAGGFSSLTKLVVLVRVFGNIPTLKIARK